MRLQSVMNSYRAQVTFFVYIRSFYNREPPQERERHKNHKFRLGTYLLAIFCTVPSPHFLGCALIWPGCFASIFSVCLDYILRVCQRLWDSSLYLGKLHWFLYLLLSYVNDPGMFIFRWSSNVVEKVVLNESMSAKMASRVSYLVYYICI